MCAGISAGQPEARGALVLVSSRLSCFFFSFQVFHPVFFSFFFFQIRRGKQSEGEDANESMRKRPTEGGREGEVHRTAIQTVLSCQICDWFSSIMASYTFQ